MLDILKMPPPPPPVLAVAPMFVWLPLMIVLPEIIVKQWLLLVMLGFPVFVVKIKFSFPESPVAVMTIIRSFTFLLKFSLFI